MSQRIAVFWSWRRLTSNSKFYQWTMIRVISSNRRSHKACIVYHLTLIRLNPKIIKAVFPLAPIPGIPVTSTTSNTQINFILKSCKPVSISGLVSRLKTRNHYEQVERINFKVFTILWNLLKLFFKKDQIGKSLGVKWKSLQRKIIKFENHWA